MKSRLIVLFFVCSAITYAIPSTADYNVTVHVSATRMVRYGNSMAHHQNLTVMIDGKKFELESLDLPNSLLMLGDYKAKIVKDRHHIAATAPANPCHAKLDKSYLGEQTSTL